MNRDDGELSDLRRDLELDGMSVNLHRARVKELGKHHRHTISYVEAVRDSTCVLYALELRNSEPYRDIARTFHTVFAGKSFMSWLHARHLQTLEVPRRGCLAMYFAGADWRHVGICIKPGRIRSQWGPFPVYEHGLFELPASYGDTLRYFECPAPAEALERYFEYARECGIPAGYIDSVRP